MKKARDAKVLIHFDPFEMLPTGINLIDQLTVDGNFKNDYLLNRGYDKENREVNERDLFSDAYDEATDKERPNYGVVDLYNLGLGAHQYAGEVAFVLKNDAKQRSTACHYDSNNIPYGEEGKWTRLLTDPHHLLVDRWYSRWKQPNKPDAQRKRAINAIMNGTSYRDDMHYFESQIHGGVDLKKDIDHILVPKGWDTDPNHKEKYERLQQFGKFMGVPIKFDGGYNYGKN
jgi:hypothetical protein